MRSWCWPKTTRPPTSKRCSTRPRLRLRLRLRLRRTLANSRASGPTGWVTQRVRKAVRVEGSVQGVAFRPFVYTLASGLGLGGLVGNDADGVFAEVEGSPTAVEQFLRRLPREAAPLARVDRVRSWPLEPAGTGPAGAGPAVTLVATPALAARPR